MEQKIDPSFFVGKVITRMITDAVNVVYIEFDDGSSCSVWSECGGDQIPYLYMDDVKE